MPLQNRVTPDGQIVRSPQRGTMMGNRGGQLHDAAQELARRRWVSKQWICCVLQFNGRKRQVMAPNRYTELFFLDEATALAAGHRPCFECRRADALQFASLWASIDGKPGRATAGDMDDRLHGERVDAAGMKKTWRSTGHELPVGTIINSQGVPHLVSPHGLLAWGPDGYKKPSPVPTQPALPTGFVDLLTPPSIVAVLSAGYRPMLHTSSTLDPT